MTSHHQRRRRPRARRLAGGAGAGRHASRLGFRRPPLSGRALAVVACAVGLVGLLATLPRAIGLGQSAPQVAVATSAAPTTLPQASGTLRTSTTRTRPRTAMSATVSTRATTTTTSGRRPSAPAAAGWVNVVNDQFSSGGVPAHWRRYDGPYGSAPHNCATPSHVSVSGGSMHLLMRYEASGRCGAGGGLGQRGQRPVQLRRGAGTLAPVRQALRLRPAQLPHPVARIGVRRLDAPADAA